jgi:WD40 repeat protein/serine/threonine protein kinase
VDKYFAMNLKSAVWKEGDFHLIFNLRYDCGYRAAIKRCQQSLLGARMGPSTIIDRFSHPDQAQARRLLELELIPAKALRAAYFAPRDEGADLCKVLSARCEISSADAEQIREYVQQQGDQGAQGLQQGPKIVWGVPDADYSAPAEQEDQGADATITINASSSSLYSSRRATQHPSKKDEKDLATRARLKMVESFKKMHAASPLFAPHADLVFEHIRQIGVGGMGIIHQIVDRRLGREAALKLIRHDRAGDLEVWRFMREARVMARLDHPSIPPIYEAGTDSDGQHYILMRVIKGMPFDECIRRYHRGEQALHQLMEYLNILVKVGEALAYAHNEGIVHRDLKPNNIMVGQFGEAMVLDWGLARDTHAREEKDREAGGRIGQDTTEDLIEEADGQEITQIGAVMGTVGYMPPEQARGEAVDQRADVFALGAVLSKLLTNQTPFDGQGTLERLRATQENRVRVPIERNPKIPAELNAIAKSALDPNVEFRTKSAQAFVQDLKAYLSGYDVSVYNYRLWEKWLRKIKRNPVPLIAIVIVTGFVGVLVQLYTVTQASREQAKLTKRAQDAANKAKESASKAKASETRAKSAEMEARDNEKIAMRAKAEAQDSARVANQARADAEQEKNRALAEGKRATDAAEAAQRARLRAEQEKVNADRNLANLFVEKADRAMAVHDILRAEAFLSKSLSLLPSSWKTRRRYLKTRLAGTRLLWTSPTRKQLNVVAVAPSQGKQPALFATAGFNGVIEIWQASTGAVRFLLSGGHQGKIHALAFNPTGAVLASGGAAGRTVLWDLKQGREISRLGNGREIDIQRLLFIDEDQLIVTGFKKVTQSNKKLSKQPFISLWNTKTRSEKVRFDAAESQITCLAIHPDGHSIVTGSRDKGISVWKLDGSLKKRIQYQAPLVDLDFSRDGELLISADQSGLITVLNADIAPVTSFVATSPNTLNAVSMAPDNRSLLTAHRDGSIQQWMPDGWKKGRRYQHRGEVRDIAFIHSALVASVGLDGLRLWDLEQAKTHLRSDGHLRVLRAVAFSPDGQLIASASDSGAVRLWDLAKRQQQRRINGWGQAVQALAFHPEGELLATGCDDHMIRFWRVKDGALLATLKGHSQAVTSLAFSSDGRTLASSCAEEANDAVNILIWDVAKRQAIEQLSYHSSAVLALAIDPTNRILASAGKDRVIRLWDLQQSRELPSLSGHKNSITSLSFGPRGLVLASASLDRHIRLWNVQSGASLGHLEGHQQAITGIDFSPDGAFLASVSQDRALHIWDVATRQILHKLTGHLDDLTGVSFAPNGRVIATVSKDRTIKLWQYRNVRLLGHPRAVLDVDFNPSGTELASASNDRTLRFWASKSGRQLDLLAGRQRKVGRVEYSPDGQLVAWANGNNTVRFAQRGRKRNIPTLTGHDNMVLGIAFSPRSSTLASASLDKTARLWDLENGREVQLFKGHSKAVSDVAFSPKADFIVTASWDTTLRIWDTKTGDELGRLTGHTDAVNSVDIARINSSVSIIASASDDNTIRLWTWTGKSARETRRFRSHSAPVRFVSFSPGGELLASASEDGSVRIFSIKAERELLSLDGHGGKGVTSVRFGVRNGKLLLASAGEDRIVRLWNVETAISNVMATIESDEDKKFKNAQILLSDADRRTGFRVRDLDLIFIPQNYLSPQY